MTRTDFIERINNAISRYLDDFELFEPAPQLSINPQTLSVELISGKERQTQLEYADEALESAAGAEGDLSEQALDFQVSQNPDFYPVRTLLKVVPGKPTVSDQTAIEAVADRYFK